MKATFYPHGATIQGSAQALHAGQRNREGFDLPVHHRASRSRRYLGIGWYELNAYRPHHEVLDIELGDVMSLRTRKGALIPGKAFLWVGHMHHDCNDGGGRDGLYAIQRSTLVFVLEQSSGFGGKERQTASFPPQKASRSFGDQTCALPER